MKLCMHKKYITICLLLGMLTSCVDDETVPAGNVTNAKKPELSEVETKAATASTITITGKVLNHNGYPVTERGIVWGTTRDLDISKDSHKSLTDDSDDIILTAEGVKSATLYYFRLYAVNKISAGYSSKSDSIWTESGLGIVETIIFEEHTRAKTAKVGGNIKSRGEGNIREYGVYIYDIADPTSIDSIISTTNIAEKDTFSCDLLNLLPSTAYQVQAYVKNDHGIFKGESKRLETSSGTPVLSDDIEVKAEWTKATITGEVISIGDAPITSRGFCWNTTGNPPQISDNKVLVVVGGTGIGIMKTDIQPLLANQQYYVFAFAENEYGIQYSKPKPFTTKSELPTVISIDVAVLNDGEAIFKGLVSDIGVSNVNRVGVCFSATKDMPTISDSMVEIVLITPVTASDVPHNYTANITDLKGGTNYSFRAYAINGTGTPSYGDPITLQTPPIFTIDAESFEGGERFEGSSAYFVIKDKGYLLGGDLGPNFINNLWSFNPISTKKWYELNPYTAGSIGWLASAVIDTRVFVLGGRGTGSVARDDFYMYNSENNVWYSRPTGPDSAYSRVGTALNNEVIFIGGIKDTAQNEVWAFNVNTNTWLQQTNFPVNQHGGIAVTINNNVYAGLGKNTLGVGNKQLWKSSGSLSNWTLEPTTASLTGTILAYTVFNDKIYLIDRALTNRLYLFEYDPAVQVWRRRSELPTNCRNIQFMFAINNRIYIGFADNDNDKVVIYNPYWDN